MQSGVALTLKYNHDYIEDSVIVFSCNRCSIYLRAEVKQFPSSFVKLQFDGVQCSRSARTDCSPAIKVCSKEPGASFIVELIESNWPAEANKSYVYAGSSVKREYRHFVITNHDIFHEVLAETFTESIVQQGDLEYEFVKILFK